MNFKQGIRDGIPIGLGYAAVSFAFGILAVDKDLTVSEAVLISLTNLTSAGQFAGLTIIAELGTLVEMALSQFIISIYLKLMMNWDKAISTNVPSSAIIVSPAN